MSVPVQTVNAKVEKLSKEADESGESVESSSGLLEGSELSSAAVAVVSTLS